MALKNWILSGVNRMNGVVGRTDLPRRGARAASEPREPSMRGVADVRASGPDPDQLGAYAPLIGAIRDELEHFAQTRLRLHLAIAERDRYRLTSIDVECIDSGDGTDLLRRFTREFTPEQIKRYLARDVIGHLPNASAIDLSQFGGLNATPSETEADDDYAEIVAQLKATTPSEGPRTFEVTLVGRWTETESATASRASAPSPRTPLAGSRLDVAIDDAGGSRHVTLSGVVPNRRYAIGKGEGCDIAVDGAFTSRRHCEIWLDNGAWWAADAGSTNGIRVETAQSVLGRCGGHAAARETKSAIEIPPGARIVLSALAQGAPSEYPSVLLRQPDVQRTPATPLGAPTIASKTPVTPIAAPIRQQRDLALTVRTASGVRTVALDEAALPMRVGRSRNQHVVVEWAHESVSGHHVDIASIDDGGADVAVHGDNGVTVDGTRHAPGTRFRWRVGEAMTLGHASGDEPPCTLTLSRSA